MTKNIKSIVEKIDNQINGCREQIKIINEKINFLEDLKKDLIEINSVDQLGQIHVDLEASDIVDEAFSGNTKIVLDAIKAIGKPVTTEQITEYINNNRKPSESEMEKSKVDTVLYRLRGNKIVVSKKYRSMNRSRNFWSLHTG